MNGKRNDEKVEQGAERGEYKNGGGVKGRENERETWGNMRGVELKK